MRASRESNSAPSPFLKWAGGKRWLIERHRDLFPEFSGKYIEPFVGGGAVFFHLLPAQALLSDCNADLISCYRQIRDDHAGVLDLLEDHHNRHCEIYYYEVRAKKYQNPTERAAQFLYLNRTCFNGLYRVNRKGEFNVPIGTKTKVFDPDEDFKSIANSLTNVQLRHGDFEGAIDSSLSGDFLFVDPPYTVKHNLNGFLKYNEKIFSWDDQVRLRDAVVRAAGRGVKVLMTNAAHGSIFELYHNIGCIERVSRPSVLAGKRTARGAVEEIALKIG